MPQVAPEVASYLKALDIPIPYMVPEGVYFGKVTLGAAVPFQTGITPAVFPAGSTLLATDTVKSPTFVDQFMGGNAALAVAQWETVALIWGCAQRIAPWDTAGARAESVADWRDVHACQVSAGLRHQAQGTQGFKTYDLDEGTVYDQYGTTVNQAVAADSFQYKSASYGPLNLAEKGGILIDMGSDQLTHGLLRAPDGGFAPETFVDLYGVFMRKSLLVTRTLAPPPSPEVMKNNIRQFFAAQRMSGWGARQ